MSSDVVRWSSISLKRKTMPSHRQKPHPIDVLGNRKQIANECNRRAGTDTRRHRPTFAVTLGKPISKLILLTIWLVIIQNVSLVLSEENLVKYSTFNYSTSDDEDANNRFSIDDIDEDVSFALLPSEDIQFMSEENSAEDLDNFFRSHHITSDDDISNNKHYTDTWAAQIPGGDEVAHDVANQHGFRVLGKVSFSFMFFVIFARVRRTNFFYRNRIQ